MKMDRSLIGLIASVCIVLVLATLIGVFTTSEAKKTVTYLHTQTAKSVEIVPMDGNKYTMTLHGVARVS